MYFKKNRALFLLIILTSCFSIKTTNQEKDALKRALIKKIKLAKQYESYWAHVQYTPISHFLTNLTNLHIKRNWNKEIEEKRYELIESINQSATILGNLCIEADSQIISKSKKDFLQEKKRILSHKIPSHLSRKWPIYALTSISAAIIYYTFTKKISITEVKEKSSLFYEKQIQEPIDNIKKYYNTLSSTQKHIESNEKNYQDSVKHIAEEIKKNETIRIIIEKDGIDLTSLITKNPIEQKSTLDRINHLIITEITSLKEATPLALTSPATIETTITPSESVSLSKKLAEKIEAMGSNLEGISTNIPNLQHHTDSITEEIKKLNPQTETSHQSDGLSLFTKTVVESSGMGELIKQSSEVLLLLKELLEKGNAIGKDGIIISHTLKEVLQKNENNINAILSNLPDISDDVKTILYNLKNDYSKIRPLINDISNDYEAVKTNIIAYEPFIKIFINLIDLDVQFYKIIALRINYQSQLPIILIGAIPAGLVFYGAYKALSNTYRSLTAMQSAEPLKYDLLQFQLHLNKYRYIKNSDLPAFYYGMECYWIAQLESYYPSLSDCYKISYAEFISELKRYDLTPEQKIIIIECMFKQYAFLQ